MWPKPTDSQELMALAGQGDAQAVEQLLARHREPVRRMIQMRLDPAVAARVDASDVVQEVLLEASRRLPDYFRQPNMPFHLWLRHIAHDHLIDSYRRHRQAQRRSVDREQRTRPAWADESAQELASLFIDQELTPATAALRQEMEGRLREALARLDDDERDIILMRHFEQLTNQEVAESLGVSEAAASMRHLRAVRELRKHLSPEG